MDDMRNLLRETTAKLREYGHGSGDVRWVESRLDDWNNGERQWCTWDEFAARAGIDYDAGFGGTAIAESLRVVGDDWWLERHEYDGSEWWEYKRRPERPGTHNARIRIRYHGDDDEESTA